MFYAPFTGGREQVYISVVPTNILKLQTFSCIQNVPQSGFLDDLHTHTHTHTHTKHYARAWLMKPSVF